MGMVFEAASDYNKILNNTIADADVDGIYISSGSDGNIINGNLLCGWGGDAIDDRGTGTVDASSTAIASSTDLYHETLCSNVGFGAYASDDFSIDADVIDAVDQLSSNYPTLDIIGTTRSEYGGGGDIGAYEFQETDTGSSSTIYGVSVNN